MKNNLTKWLSRFRLWRETDPFKFTPNPYRAWRVLVGFWLAVTIVVIGIGSFLALNPDWLVQIMKVDDAGSALVNLLERQEVEKAVSLIEARRAEFEGLAQSSSTPALVDPSK